MKSYRELYDEKKNKKTKCGRNQCRKESGKDRQTIKEYAKKQTKIQKKKKKTVLKKTIIEQERMGWSFDSLEPVMAHYQTTI